MNRAPEPLAANPRRHINRRRRSPRAEEEYENPTRPITTGSTNTAQACFAMVNGAVEVEEREHPAEQQQRARRDRRARGWWAMM